MLAKALEISFGGIEDPSHISKLLQCLAFAPHASSTSNNVNANGEAAHSQVATPGRSRTANAVGRSLEHTEAKMHITNCAKAVGEHISLKSLVMNPCSCQLAKEKMEKEAKMEKVAKTEKEAQTQHQLW